MLGVSVSVVILNYNTYHLTRRCLESVYKYIPECSCEIIVVDNNSKEEKTQEIPVLFPEVIFVANKQNIGFAAGNNIGLKQAKGEYILLLNSDTELTCDCITPAVSFLEKNPAVGAFTTRIIYPDGRPQPVIQRFPSIKKELKNLFRWQKLCPQKNNMLGEFHDYNKAAIGDWIWGTFFFTKRSAIDQLPNKKLPDDFFMYGEDIQWGYELKKIGLNVAYEPVGDVIHYIAGSTEPSKMSTREKAIDKNEFLLVKQQHSRLYISLLYFIRALVYLSIRKPRLSAKYFRLIFNTTK